MVPQEELKGFQHLGPTLQPGDSPNVNHLFPLEASHRGCLGDRFTHKERDLEHSLRSNLLRQHETSHVVARDDNCSRLFHGSETNSVLSKKAYSCDGVRSTTAPVEVLRPACSPELARADLELRPRESS